MDSARIWSQSTARASLMGRERTHNPSPAASSMLGKRAVRKAKRKLRRGGRKRAHKGNPSPAVVSTLAGLIPGGSLVSGLLGGLGGRFRTPSEVRAAKVAPAVVQAANAGNLTAAAGLIERAARPMIAKEHAVWAAAAAQLAPSIVAAVKVHMKSIPAADQSGPEQFAASVLASPVQVPGTAPTGYQSALGVLQTPGLVQTIGRIATPRRSRRQRYPTYSDRYGRQRYSTKPPGSQMRLPAGATPSPGTAYSFFRGAVGKGGAGTTAAQLGVAAAAGAAAYLVTQKLLQYLGGRAQAKEEAGVLAARALHETLEEYKQQHGAYPPPAERAEMKAAYRAKLVELGYNPDTFTRTRGAVAGFLEDYNPFGG